MPMAADHRKKRLNGVSIAGCSSGEQYKRKKKKLECSKNESNTKSHISLEWDGNKKMVVAKREQISLRQKDLREFVDNSTQCHSILADVIAIPQEIFEFENLTQVLSYQVWKTHLSENERKYLMQFLPRGSDAEKVLQALLAGDNFHFGNPYLKWCASLCSGNLHPDAVVHQEQCIKADKKAYYSEIQTYHNDMIEYLQKLKETWESSKDPEKEVLQKIWRSRKDADRQFASHANESGFHDLEEDVADTSESCSLVAEERACSSDDQYSSISKGGELQRRTHEKVFMKEKSRKSSVALDDARPRRGEKLQKHNIHHTDGVKYLSYLKISKKQHELVKSMKQSGKSIQSKSLNRLLGNLDSLQVQPFEEFVKEEQNKLQEHWLQLAKRDLPAAFENWLRRKLQRREITKSLEQDITERLESLMDDEKLNCETVLQDQNDQGERSHECEEEDEEDFSQEALLQDQNDQETMTCELYLEGEEKLIDETLFEDQNDEDLRKHESSTEEEKESHDTDLLEDQSGARNQESYVEDDEHSGSGSLQYQSPQHLSSPSGDHDLNPIDMDSENNHVVDSKDNHVVDSEDNHVATKSDDTSPNASEYSGNANTADASISQGAPIPSGRDLWPAVSMPHNFYDSSMNHEYASTNELSLPHSINEVQRTPLIDLESDVHEEDAGKNLLQRQSDDGSFNSYPNQDRSGLLQSLFKGQEMLSYCREQKQMGLDFQLPQNMMMEDSHFSGHLQRQLQPAVPLEQGQKRHGENYMQPPISESIYSQGGPYSIPRREPEPPVVLQDWPVNPVRMPARVQSHLNNDALLTQNWYSGEHQIRGGWNSTDCASISGQGIGNNTDQSLYSVLSQYNQLRLGNHSNSMGPTEQYMMPRNYEMASGIASRINTSLPQGGLSHDYLSGRDAGSSLMPDEMGWMTLPQNPGLHDPVGKSYLRSWNH